MSSSIPQAMQAAAIDRFGGPEVIRVQSLPVPTPGAGEVLIGLDTAGIGVWDPYVRDGRVRAERRRLASRRCIGNDGAGTVVAIGRRGSSGSRSATASTPSRWTAASTPSTSPSTRTTVALVPPGVGRDEAGALGADGITALRGPRRSSCACARARRVMVFGASGGIGHLAVQLAKRMGAQVLAVASGPDGVELVRRLGADAAVDGRTATTSAGGPRGSRPTGSMRRWCSSAATAPTRRWRR